MYDFITNLFNLDKNMIKFVNIVSFPVVTQLHISLIPKRFPCPYCHGVDHLNGYSKPKVINHPK